MVFFVLLLVLLLKVKDDLTNTRSKSLSLRSFRIIREKSTDNPSKSTDNSKTKNIATGKLGMGTPFPFFLFQHFDLMVSQTGN